MSQPFSRLDPMNQSMYLEDQFPLNYEEVHRYVNSYPNPVSMPDGPQLAPQPTKDSIYYSNDGRNDGHISMFEKLKAIAKGGTYNLVKGMFCDENGFSWKRTLLSAGAATAIALTGPVGMAIAGTLGLVSAADNFIHSAELAKNAKTDQDARDAYEGIGESASTAGLSIWAGLRGFKGLASKWFHKSPKVVPPPTGEIIQPTGEVTPPPVEVPSPTGGSIPPTVEPAPEVTPPVRPVKPEGTTTRKSGNKKAGNKQTSKKKTTKSKANQATSVAQARSYTDRIYNIDTTPNPDVEYFYYANPTNKMPDAGFNEPNHFFG